MPADKYKVFQNVTDWTVNLGYPGYANAAIDEIYNSWLISTMFAKCASGKLSPEAALAEASSAANEHLREVARQRQGLDADPARAGWRAPDHDLCAQHCRASGTRQGDCEGFSS